MRLVLLFVMFVVPLSSFADIYKCTVNGETKFSDKPCGDNAVVIKKSPESANSSAEQTEWKFIRHKDEMTNAVTGLALSPKVFVGTQGRTFYFASLRVGGTQENPLVVIKSEQGFEDNPESFHNDISGLGIKLGEGEFLPAERKVGSYLLGFSGSAAVQIVQQLQASQPFRFRLRFWPYEKTYDTPPKSHAGFNAAFEQVKACGG